MLALRNWRVRRWTWGGRVCTSPEYCSEEDDGKEEMKEGMREGKR